jgi:hypothetical protein
LVQHTDGGLQHIGWEVAAHWMAQNKSLKLLPEDEDKMLCKKRVTSCISKQTYTFPDVFIFQ